MRSHFVINQFPAALAQRFSESLAEFPGDWLTWLYLARLGERLRANGLPVTEPAQQALAQAQSL
jgi:hypothetical protein